MVIFQEHILFLIEQTVDEKMMNSRTKENEKANGSPFLLLMDRIIPVTMIEASINSSRGNLLYFILRFEKIIMMN